METLIRIFAVIGSILIMGAAGAMDTGTCSWIAATLIMVIGFVLLLPLIVEKATNKNAF